MKRSAAIPDFIYEFPAYWTIPVYEDTLGMGGVFAPPHPFLPLKTTYHSSPGPRSPPSRPRPRRSHTMNVPPSTHPEHPPWAHVAQTYAWVLDQSFAEMARKNEETVRWIMEQQRRDVLRAVEATREAMAFVHSVAAGEIWTAPVDARWRREAEDSVQEELRRLQQARQNTERCRKSYERRKAEEADMERRRGESRWALIAGPSSPKKRTEPLTFRSIPWPMFVQPETVEDITPARITLFVLSPSHSEGQSRKERIKAALRRWHPDRFGRWIARVDECDRRKVEEGAGIVVRCLNDLLERDDDQV
ncbi:uncharacterized protein B0H18DRAFT_1040487 [Fomitopsis serialis]|uniref:uncharacterized protein n=1 Tax=Fomitopsis serialis TaxID=139415 RepID=UPI0020076F5B|nr:uncharacterized protein B0H18DRAFT_1040487 [Neoantrodia serialis]KAH9915695.1 hypothetical protein B0H18DRAFT_1040487 [Neoantrodia serialis]